MGVKYIGETMLIDLPDSTKRLLTALVMQQPDKLSNLRIAYLCQVSGLGQMTVKRHLKILRSLKLVRCKRAGRGVPYSFSIAPQCYVSLRADERYRIS